MTMRKSILAAIVALVWVSSVGAQSLFRDKSAGIFKVGLAVDMETQGYTQDGVLLNRESLYNGLSFYNTDTQVFCAEGRRFSTIGKATLIGAVALMIGGTAVTVVAASGVSDRDGTMSMYATGIGLFLGTAGMGIGSLYSQRRSASSYRLAVEAYNASLTEEK